MTLGLLVETQAKHKSADAGCTTKEEWLTILFTIKHSPKVDGPQKINPAGPHPSSCEA
eukprot:CAMPEP_0183400148 /NCGR_PEP_ID=MMETSP0370-20130417/12404_1 /TAXON_ID=268820 /ORGANISM="Peridinium aciculiferum, Strain PAER-2" /LENGTH=57 /DNA_ID=CAMNT_0025581407 /DNA_START=131 /DNA_END=301 /DNA_ORIENTATION=+